MRPPRRLCEVVCAPACRVRLCIQSPSSLQSRRRASPHVVMLSPSSMPGCIAYVIAQRLPQNAPSSAVLLALRSPPLRAAQRGDDSSLLQSHPFQMILISSLSCASVVSTQCPDYHYMVLENFVTDCWGSHAIVRANWQNDVLRLARPTPQKGGLLCTE